MRFRGHLLLHFAGLPLQSHPLSRFDKIVNLSHHYALILTVFHDFDHSDTDFHGFDHSVILGCPRSRFGNDGDFGHWKKVSKSGDFTETGIEKNDVLSHHQTLILTVLTKMTVFD